MKNSGMNETMMIAGLWTPTPTISTKNPTVAAKLYAGAVDATPITMFEMYEIAFFFICGGPVGEPFDPVSDSVSVDTALPRSR